ncbi:glycosyltransferase [Chitinophaga nivalis]|uniref:Glycosyltransferase n=1 Tax=Chitinophaga nivalis TaxID=2991709 RepID=A0ABT3IU56_9BACT|nr:glycosyltransferase [Chitinophaga nivalis]MCW3462779.1 glycosyltransferase [Chitinophaga nivalis]MCW3487531.1 glycosyltransferase [Chitinophaga nivalis]
MISIVIPVLNEGATIRQVIKTVKKTARKIEIIVVDDNSTDNTVEEAMKENVRVITSSQRGKGISMREGMMAAKHDIIAYVDGDILTYPDNIVDLLTGPIENDEADFVKSYFERQAGRVTQLVAKPLLSILYPDLAHFQQPLSGMIAARKSMLASVQFENDYGVDIGLLIDMHHLGARITEANIGKVENAMQTWEQLSKMSREVSRTILKKAENIPQENLETLGNINLIREQMEYSILESIDKLQKMVIFNLDHAVFTQPYLECAAIAFDKEEELHRILGAHTDPVTLNTRIAALFEGRNIAELLEVADAIPLVPDIREVVRELKKRGYACGLVTDGFGMVARHIKNKLGMDFVFANKLHLVNSVATGELTIGEYFLKEGQYCKSHLLPYISREYKMNTQNIIYVGDGKQDGRLLIEAGIGVAFCPQYQRAHVEKVADKIISGLSLAPLLDIAQASPAKFGIKLPVITKKQARNIGVGSLVGLAGAGLLYLAIKQIRKKHTASC